VSVLDPGPVPSHLRGSAPETGRRPRPPERANLAVSGVPQKTGYHQEDLFWL